MLSSPHPTPGANISRIRGRAALVIGLVVASLVATPALSATAADPTSTISGVVTMPDGSVPDANITLSYCGDTATTNGCYSFAAGQYHYDAATGAYTGSGIPPGNYYFEWRYGGPSALVAQYYQNGFLDYQTASAHRLYFSNGSSATQNISLLKTATITGSIAGLGGGVVATATVGVSRSSDSVAGPNSYAATFDSASGTYSVTGLIPGTYSVRVAPQSPGWISAAHSSLAVTGGSTVRSDFVLDHLPSISGQLFVDDGTGPQPYQGPYTISAGTITYNPQQTNPDGTFSTWIPVATSYLCIPQSIYIRQTCWTNNPSDQATGIDVPVNGTRGGFTITAKEYGNIHAELQGQLNDGIFDLQSGEMDTYRLDTATGNYVLYGYPGHGGYPGAYSDYLPAGTYRVEFTDAADHLNSQWWKSTRYAEDAKDIIVTAGQTQDLGNVVLQPRSVEQFRTFGDDRFSGAVEMSKANYYVDGQGQTTVPANGVPVVYIANGLNYPDALSAGPAAIKQDGVLLLVLPTSIPAVVSTELTRLHPQKIVIVGGPASVSDDVEAQLRTNAVHDGYPTVVSRQSGGDRFEASRNLALTVWGKAVDGKGAKNVFIATGNNFPDALVSGPAAGSVDAPVILVNGTLSQLDGATAQLLADLGATDVTLVGGPGSVSVGIEASLDDLVGSHHVVRYSGDDRYEAAAAVSAAFFPNADTMFLATGSNYPDALTGAPLAAVFDAPIYLARTTCIPEVVVSQLLASNVQALWLLGGPGSLSDDVYGTVCSS